MRTGEVQVRGPMTREDEADRDALRTRQRECEQELADLRALLAEDPDRPDRAQIEADVAHDAAMLDLNAKVIPE